MPASIQRPPLPPFPPPPPPPPATCPPRLPTPPSTSRPRCGWRASWPGPGRPLCGKTCPTAGRCLRVTFQCVVSRLHCRELCLSFPPTDLASVMSCDQGQGMQFCCCFFLKLGGSLWEGREGGSRAEPPGGSPFRMVWVWSKQIFSEGEKRQKRWKCGGFLWVAMFIFYIHLQRRSCVTHGHVCVSPSMIWIRC